MKHPRHAHRVALSYPVSMGQRLYVIVLGPLAIFAAMYALLAFFPHTPIAGGTLGFQEILLASAYTCARLFIAYMCAIVVAVPLALLVTHKPAFEAFFLPVFDIFESIPILALFPVIILLFIQFNFLNGAAIFILFLSMLWNLVFTLVGGLKIIPVDILYAARVFGLGGFAYLRRVILPALFPQFVTGSILAVAQGWNLIIVAEVLHTYIPGGTAAQDLFGVGSILVSAAAHADTGAFLSSVFIMVMLIALLNFFVWQKLLHISQRFRFE